jgi:hypothetical protein
LPQYLPRLPKYTKIYEWPPAEVITQAASVSSLDIFGGAIEYDSSSLNAFFEIRDRLAQSASDLGKLARSEDKKGGNEN